MEQHNEKQAGLIFLDAEKAFDNLNWTFMFKVLENMDFGDNFIQGIKSIYVSQKSHIIVNGDLTEPCHIQKGTRQGCPLSPLLFILVLEALNRDIRQDDQIKGLKIKKVFKLRAFANDLVLILQDPLNVVEHLMKKLKEFGSLAGLKVNKQKTNMLIKDMTTHNQEMLMGKTGFIIEKKVRYLGVTLSNTNCMLFQNNCAKLWSDVKKDLLRWEKLQLSMMGQISVIKMNVLPRMLFLFQTILILTTDLPFKQWQKDISKFIWQGKKPRIKYKLLQDAKE